ncbi:MAG TPA: class I SAM-dependent methyltransferase [Bacteroidetes bacterium]|nr:class I SAM-dependent methyltransferase [Bacteroidota bacterium]
MKIFESSPARYDTGIRLLSFGTLDHTYERLLAPLQPGRKVLDIGCGTGKLTLKAARKGAFVKGIDLNPEMLAIAKKHAADEGFEQNIEFSEIGVAELSGEKTESYDVVTSGLCFSELSEDEINYTLKEIKRLLKPDGYLLIADEVVPENYIKKIIHFIFRLPLALITYILTQTTTQAVKNLPKKIDAAGFFIASVRLNKMGNFMELTAIKKKV